MYSVSSEGRKGGRVRLHSGLPVRRTQIGLRCALVAMISGLGAAQALAQCQCREQQKLTAPDAAVTDGFGAAVSVSGDTAVVGASGDDCLQGFNCGSAYVFRFNGTSWVQQQKLTASDAAAGRFFGGRVSVSGDTALVGASFDACVAGVRCGAAYVFRFNGTSWVEEQKLTASDAAVFDEFGSSVSVSGDTAVVGARFDACAAGNRCGAAYVFRFNGISWVQQQKLTASDAAASDLFGGSVSVSGDTVVLGSARVAAYVFWFNGTSWVEEQKLTASDAVPGDGFGFSVSVSGNTAVVGAYLDDCPAGNFCGSAYVFRFNGTGWVEEQKVIASDVGAGEFFGFSVSVSGETAVVGAGRNDCAAGFDCGAAYVFRFNGTSWVQKQKLTASDAAVGDEFGSSVAVSGETAVVGARFDACAAGNRCGSAYVFRVPEFPGPGPADLDGDGDVDLFDFASFQAQFTGPQ